MVNFNPVPLRVQVGFQILKYSFINIQFLSLFLIFLILINEEDITDKIKIKKGKITVLNDLETGEIDEIIFRSQDGKEELTFQEWFDELEIDFIIHRRKINEE